MSRSCQKPDRDEPRLICGYPLPCPWHTARVDVDKRQIALPIVLPSGTTVELVAPITSDSRLAAVVDIVSGAVSSLPPKRKRRRR